MKQKLTELVNKLHEKIDYVKNPNEYLDLIWDIEAFINGRPTIFKCDEQTYIAMAETKLIKKIY